MRTTLAESAVGTGALRRPRRQAQRQATERIDKAATFGQPFRPLERERGHRSAMSLPSQQSGILLMDCLIYMGLLFLIVSMAYVVFYRGWDNSLNLRRGADQIAAALSAGERWREDVRTATGPGHAESTNGEQILRLPHGKDEVDYRATRDAVLRRANVNADWREVLNRVKSSRMEPDPRQNVTAWRWDVELKTRQPKRKFQPVFTFEAVPMQNATGPVVADMK
ncbi:MAG TPA: hypothetical protein VN281_11565 [Verrucomicrobiae bacterium]|jgi:hypothetical protein|nr:hypothetical protein [Verrucomicrobiae bacterium]